MPIGRVKLSEAVCISGVDNITLEKTLEMQAILLLFEAERFTLKTFLLEPCNC